MTESLGAPLNRLSFDNPWIAAVDRAPRRAPVWAVLVGGVAAAAAAGLLGRSFGAPVMTALQARLPGPLGAAVSEAIFYLLVFAPLVLTALLGAAVEGRQVWPAERRPMLAAALGGLLGVGGFSLAAGLALAAGVVVHGSGLQSGAAIAGVLVGVVAIAYQAGAEELLFRGWMQPVLCARLGPWVGLLVVSLLFAALHLVGGARSPLTVLNLILGGLMFGLLAMRSGGLWAAFCAHAGWNWTEACGLGLDPNPGVGSTGALIDLDLAGRPLWSGGADAMNGSLAETIALVVIVSALLALAPAGRSPPR